ncbi:MAG: Hsp20/alpha crystallin family protein [Deltaproteobacteria bacterium]|nr:Hsp20/alpha crystallin family protein [Deltaproteobacteria bacterium]
MAPRPPHDPFSEFADRLGGTRWRPSVDVFETEKSIVVRLELAGVRIADLSVTVDGDLLRISGFRHAERAEGVQRLHQVEIAFGPFERVLRIEVPFERDCVSAHLEDGFLTVELPRQTPRRLSVDV